MINKHKLQVKMKP